MAIHVAETALRIAIQCEVCNTRWSFYKKHSNSTTAILPPFIGAKDPSVGLAKTVAASSSPSDVGWKRCPKCGYVQSWMLDSWKNGNLVFCALLSIIIVVGLCSIFGWSDLGFAIYLLAFGVIFGILVSLMRFLPQDPNRRWKKSHNGLIPKSRNPRITQIHPKSIPLGAAFNGIEIDEPVSDRCRHCGAEIPGTSVFCMACGRLCTVFQILILAGAIIEILVVFLLTLFASTRVARLAFVVSVASLCYAAIEIRKSIAKAKGRDTHTQSKQ